MKLNRTHITNGLLKKIVKACQLANNSIVTKVSIKNRKGVEFIHVKRVKHKGMFKFIIIDKFGKNLAGLLEKALEWSPSYSLHGGLVNFIKSRLVWGFEMEGAL